MARPRTEQPKYMRPPNAILAHRFDPRIGLLPETGDMGGDGGGVSIPVISNSGQTILAAMATFATVSMSVQIVTRMRGVWFSDVAIG